ncbi:hypothetical protein BVRB_2g023410 [Beta vulgaris subsp. vulgaris]|nr:hypothetical protein BVRB_2g023410 [Beta vulgaris subsp. vulgaris]
MVLSIFSAHATPKIFCSINENITHGPKIKQDDVLEGRGYYRIEPSKWHNSPPLVNALKAAAEDNVAMFGFPGHNRGRVAPLPMIQLIGERSFLHDISEVDSLYTPQGPILEAQKQAAEVFGASKTWFLVGGTTCGIHAAIMGACSPGDTLILPRNSHTAAISAMVLSGVVPKYIFPDYDFDWDMPTTISPSQVKRAIEELKSEGRKPGAVFITSPTYQGLCINIKAISELCNLHNIPLIVDEAHGAHFKFHPSLPLSALEQGITVYDFPNIDPLRATFGVYDLGVSGYEADDFLFMDQKVISELSAPRYLTVMIPPGTCREHINRLILGFKHLSSSSSFIQHQRKNEIKHVDVNINMWKDIDMKLSPREAFFAKKKKVDVKDAVGKICGELICPFPPGIPITAPGEVISERVIDILLQFKDDGAKVVGACDPLLSSILTGARRMMSLQVSMLWSSSGLARLSPRLNDIDYTVVNECNGLVLLTSWRQWDPFVICNLLMGEQITVEQCSRPGNWSVVDYGLGYCPVSRQFKVLRVLQNNEDDESSDDEIIEDNNNNDKFFVADIQTLGSNEWRTVEGEAPLNFDTLGIGAFLESGAFLHGSLHRYSNMDNSIWSFHFSKEQFCQVPTLDEMKRGGYKCLHVFDNSCLVLTSVNKLLDQCVVWIMKEYGVEDSWVKFCVVETQYCFPVVPMLRMSSSREILFSHYNELYLLEACSDFADIRSWKKLMDYDVCNGFNVMAPCHVKFSKFSR